MRRDPRSAPRWSLAPLLLHHTALDKAARAPAPSASRPPLQRGVASPATVVFELHEQRHPPPTPTPTQRAFKAQTAGPTHRFF